MRNCIPAQCSVARSLCSITRTSADPIRSRLPITFRRIECSRQRRVCVSSWRRSSANRVRTSAVGRCQLAAEKAYRVSVSTPRRAAAVTMASTVFAPARCPALRGRLRRAAQRPLPSMMMAICIVDSLCDTKLMGKKRLAAARRLDHRLDMIEVAVERAPAQRRQAVDRLGAPLLEGLRAGEVLRFLELSRMRAQIAVADFEQRFQLVE